MILDTIPSSSRLSPPPPFSDIAEHPLLDTSSPLDVTAPLFSQPTEDVTAPLLQHGGEAPPDFQPYEADYTLTYAGNVVSHDHHLNEDGEALYRFLLSHSSTPPTLQCHIRGTHTETRHHNTSNSGPRRTTTDTVTDFDFSIDLTSLLLRPPALYSVADDEPAYRGGMRRQFGDGKTVGLAEDWKANGRRKERKRKGLPPWDLEEGGEGRTMRSSRSVREWADDYSASQKVLKEFEYRKVIYGWDFQALEDAIRKAIERTFYYGTVSIDFPLHGTYIYVRPSTRFSRLLSNPPMKGLLWILLIYPFILLFKHFHPRGGGRWAVAGEAWALKRPRRVAPQPVDVKVKGAREENGVEGVKEGQWFRAWEGRICRAVVDRVIGGRVLEASGVEGYGSTDDPGSALDGYHD